MPIPIPVLCPDGQYVSETKETWESVLESMYEEDDDNRDFTFEDRIEEALTSLARRKNRKGWTEEGELQRTWRAEKQNKTKE